MKKYNTFLVGLLIIALSQASSQSYYFKKYGVQEGLPSDIVKGCSQDSMGYFWIATDEGVAKYDGISFTSYPSVAHSNYFKGFLNTNNERLIIFGDLDIYEINNLGDTVIFRKLANTSRMENDSSISFPKSVYEDKQGSLWISEAESIVKLSDDSFKRYEFGPSNRTTQFLRSFSIFEDQNDDLFVISYTGNVFLYDKEVDAFKAHAVDFPTHIEYCKVLGDKVLIGSKDGLFTAKLIAGGGILPPTLAGDISNVSYIQKLDQNRFFVATRESTHYFTDKSFQNFSEIPYKIDDINNVYLTDEQDIWISSNDGLILLKPNLFRSTPSELFVEAIAENREEELVYYADATTLFALNQLTKEIKPIHQIEGGYFQDLLSTPEGIWIANAFEVFLYREGKILKKFDFSDQSQFVSKLSRDSQDNIWVTIQENNSAIKINRQFKLTSLQLSGKITSSINMIKEGHDGMYIAASGDDTYLYHKQEEDTIFHNISAPLNFETKTNLEVSNLAFVDEQVFMASSEGLLIYDHTGISRVDLGEFTTLPIRSIESYEENKLLLANAFGLLLYDIKNGVTTLFNESYGLASRAITPNGIMVDENSNVWVSTSKGVCYSSSSISGSMKTKKPRIVEVKVNGKKVSGYDKITSNYEDFISLKISSITFPERDVNYQYRLGKEEEWNNFSEELMIPSLRPGTYTLELRAEKYGPFTWSDNTKLSLEIKALYWQKWWFILLIIVGVLLVIWSIYWYVEKQNRMKNLRLQALVNEKTKMLQAVNDDLSMLNEEKNNLIGIVAHDLKSPLAQILGLVDLIVDDQSISEQNREILNMVKQATNNQVKMIHKILDVNQIESKKLAIKVEEVNLPEFLQALISQNQPVASEKEIEIKDEISKDISIYTDIGYLRQTMANLLSNAIKFSPKNSNIYLKAFQKGNKAICEVRDEGPGISEEDQKKLFKKYQKLSAKPTGNESSTGLGLSIVKKFIKALDAEIWVESEVGKGTSFFVALPLDRK